MYAVIRRYRLAEGASIEELMARVHRDFVPLVGRVPGFVAFHALDAGDGAVVSVSVFDGREGAEESTRLSADHVGQELAAFFAGPPEIEQGEVGAHALRPTAGSESPSILNPAG
ncbi:MAG: hypothetical protein AVDCRST_MAG19-4532 [uncultured Thermomicrobiales bacterium]|uniref:ABM domain-containing protein n=1 Tax=uncultured Thermomicrobiales bacterium TaxID=1645740 RepID=A0A6J4VRL1_9BACT|nr:MAG: hypothetical protein AVDCRST_MAG19-4532 [uncultured Thermomicrobiales bacterium]